MLEEDRPRFFFRRSEFASSQIGMLAVKLKLSINLGGSRVPQCSSHGNYVSPFL